jgi:hypothetical protein
MLLWPSTAFSSAISFRMLLSLVLWKVLMMTFCPVDFLMPWYAVPDAPEPISWPNV